LALRTDLVAAKEKAASGGELPEAVVTPFSFLDGNGGGGQGASN